MTNDDDIPESFKEGMRQIEAGELMDFPEDLPDPSLTPDEHIYMSAVMETNNEEYDFNFSAEKIAKARGQIVVLPSCNMLQIDIDSADQWDRFMDRFDMLGWNYEWTYVHKSRSGPNRFHVYIIVPNKIFTTCERLLLQAMLEDDPKRCWLNFLRYNDGVKDPSRLFEAPGFDVLTGLSVILTKIVSEPQGIPEAVDKG